MNVVDTVHGSVRWSVTPVAAVEERRDSRRARTADRRRLHEQRPPAVVRERGGEGRRRRLQRKRAEVDGRPASASARAACRAGTRRRSARCRPARGWATARRRPRTAHCRRLKTAARRPRPAPVAVRRTRGPSLRVDVALVHLASAGLMRRPRGAHRAAAPAPTTSGDCDSNATIRPSPRSTGRRSAFDAGRPSGVTETIVVRTVVRSRTNTSSTPFFPPAMSVSAGDSKATRVPSAEIDGANAGWSGAPFAGSATVRRLTCSVCPARMSRTNTWVPGPVFQGTRTSPPSETNATASPSAEIDGDVSSPVHAAALADRDDDRLLRAQVVPDDVRVVAPTRHDVRVAGV